MEELNYFKEGWHHIISKEALDHQLFILALAVVYTLFEWKQVLILVTAFTIGHSVTLALSTLNIITIPSRLVEFLIPCTIVITAINNVFQKTSSQKNIRLNYFFALFFGLVHGLGFANTLRFIKAPDESLGWVLLQFNLGLEAGQILVVITILLIGHLFMYFLKVSRNAWILFISGGVFSLALKMILERLP